VAESVRSGAGQGAYRLLPLLHHSPAASALAPDLRVAVENAYRDAQIRFVQLERELAAIISLLADAGITAMPLKGYALARAHYISPAHRPMADLDVAVHASRYAEAAALMLARCGSRAKPERRPLAVRPGKHAWTVITEAGTEVDLHHKLLFCSRWNGADDGFWARAVPLAVRGRPAVRLSAVDQLLHACLHGYRENPGPSPVRWMADALAILGQGRLGPAEWSTLVTEAGRHRFERVLCATLAYLAARLDAPVPPEVLDRLAKAPERPFDDRYFRFNGRQPHRRTQAWRLTAAWYDYRRHRHGTLAPVAALAFLASVPRRWGIAEPAPAVTANPRA
jgi:hypothetical protein